MAGMGREPATSTRRNGSSELLDIVVLIGACLCLIGYAVGPVKMGCAPVGFAMSKTVLVPLRRFCYH